MFDTYVTIVGQREPRSVPSPRRDGGSRYPTSVALPTIGLCCVSVDSAVALPAIVDSASAVSVPINRFRRVRSMVGFLSWVWPSLPLAFLAEMSDVRRT